ncbi:MAG TPA: dienelactone hydrolase family protein [Candidatus Dormibacteraeota bacterium]|nr:dienelactone hydrolase family protein [Candidatus Dormibacteraeota bacterium]
MQTREIDRSELKGGGYIATPDGSGPHPGVVVIHEAYGLNDHIKDVTHRFAEAGYVALAVDLFTDRNRAVCMARYMGGMLIGSVNRYGIDDLKAGLTYLANDRTVDAQRLGAIGFCMGGGFAIAWACTDSRLKAIAPFYAANPRPLEVVNRICPVVGSYPAKDFTASAGRALDTALDEYNITHDIKIYPGAKHSFFNDRRDSYDKAAAEDSWTRVLTFFGEQIGGPETAETNRLTD